MRLSTLLLILTCLVSQAFANDKGGFYEGVDPTIKISDKPLGNIDHSIAPVDQEVKTNYYGYKLGGGGDGFFVTSEVMKGNANTNLVAKQYSLSAATPQSTPGSLTPSTNYNVKANVGYEFNKHLSGFITYDVGSVSYNFGQRSVNIGANKFGSNTLGVGSLIKFSDDFGIKIDYNQQQIDGGNSSGPVKSDSVKVGTVFGF